MKDKLNKIKHRQWFRPVAPSILKEEVHNWFEEDVDSPYMNLVAVLKKEKRDLVPSVCHIDNTARLQTVTKNNCPWYYDLLKKWNEKTNVPILCCTSLNDSEPIVETPAHAIKCFLSTEIDYVYFYDYDILCTKFIENN